MIIQDNISNSTQGNIILSHNLLHPFDLVRRDICSFNSNVSTLFNQGEIIAAMLRTTQQHSGVILHISTRYGITLPTQTIKFSALRHIYTPVQHVISFHSNTHG